MERKWKQCSSQSNVTWANHGMHRTVHTAAFWISCRAHWVIQWRSNWNMRDCEQVLAVQYRRWLHFTKGLLAMNDTCSLGKSIVQEYPQIAHQFSLGEYYPVKSQKWQFMVGAKIQSHSIFLRSSPSQFLPIQAFMPQVTGQTLETAPTVWCGIEIYNRVSSHADDTLPHAICLLYLVASGRYLKS